MMDSCDSGGDDEAGLDDGDETSQDSDNNDDDPVPVYPEGCAPGDGASPKDLEDEVVTPAPKPQLRIAREDDGASVKTAARQT